MVKIVIWYFFTCFSDGKVYDGHGRQVKYYRDVPGILKRLHSEGYKLAVASRYSRAFIQLLIIITLFWLRQFWILYSALMRWGTRDILVIIFRISP